MKPSISVIVPIYKTEKYLDKCLNSIRNQTFEDIEIICVDDCSPDESYKIVLDHKENDPRIVFIRHEKNAGLGGARNTAIKAAKADWIASVDSDDYIHPEMLKRLWEETENGQYDIVSCGFEHVSSNGEIVSTHLKDAQIIDVKNDDVDIFSVANPAFWNKIWKKSLYTENEIFFPEHVYYQDAATTPRIIAKSKRIKVIREILYYYLSREDSATYTYSSKHILDYFKVFDVIVEFLNSNGFYEKYIDKFTDYIDRSLKFHAGNVLSSSLSGDEKSQYLRHFLLLKVSYFESNEFLFEADPLELERLVSTAHTKEDLLPLDGNEKLPVSVIVKTFLRPEMLERFLMSVGNFEQKHGIRFEEIIVGDDSPRDVLIANDRAIRRVRRHYPFSNIEHEQYEENIGLAEGRNRLVARSKSEFVLLCDDDFIIDVEADIQKALGYVQNRDFDIVGGWLKNEYDVETGDYMYWGACGRISETKEEIFFELDECEHEDMAEIQPSDYLLNFFIARRNALIDVPWDADLKVEEHQEFFYRFFKSPYKAALCRDFFVQHTADRSDNPPRYNEYRFGRENWEKFLYMAVERMGKVRRTINRVRDDKFVTWQVDARARTNLHQSVPLLEPVIGQRVPIKNVSRKYQNFFFGYYDVQSESDDGRYLVCQSAPVINRLPLSSDVASIVLIDRNGVDEVREIGATTAWCHQQGCHLQFVPNRPSSVIYNVFDEDEKIFRSHEYDVISGARRVHEFPVAALASDGKKAASINFSRLYDYRPGYGYGHVRDPFFDETAPERDGLTIFDLDSGEAKLVLSYQQIRDLLAQGQLDRYADEKWVINHVAFNPSSSKILMLVRTFSNDAPFPTFTIVCNADGSELRRVFGFCSHYHWKDDVTFVASGAPGFTRQEAKPIKVYEVNSDTLQYEVLADGILTNDGHCSYSPDRNFLLYDSYASESFPYRRLYVYDLVAQRSMDLGYFYSNEKWYGSNTDLRCDLHPRWSKDGKTITFDSIHEGFRGVYSINTSDIRNEFAKEISVFDEADYRKWYASKYSRKNSVAKGRKRKINEAKYNELFNDAREFYNLEDYKTALRLFTECLSIDPDDVKVKRSLAETLVKMDRTKEAIRHLQEVRRSLPKNKNNKKRLQALKNPFWKMVYGDKPYQV
ncbi:glycosyltransferase [uncultured Cohaesibacter sp.]|uniref:glycosyltransferase n=1 Tax=uncultured Cohaesibacter sp. TaxID=1002546 RepID=UPI0029C820E8|nr:glycosyltransferase [uncultured Cohaesibacter sp.]